MKKVFTLLLVFTLSLGINAQDKVAKIEFETETIDYGTIEKGADGVRVFKFKNTGDAPLVITNIKSTCGCTIPQDWSKEPLAPGAEAKFTVKFNGKGNGNTSKAVTVTANTEKGTEVVRIKAFIKPDPNAPKKAAKTPSASPIVR